MTKDDVNAVYLIDFTSSDTTDALSFVVTIYNDNPVNAQNLLQIDEVYSESFEISSIIFYVESNYENNSIIWYNENHSVWINGIIHIEAIKEIINLYYGGQL